MLESDTSPLDFESESNFAHVGRQFQAELRNFDEDGFGLNGRVRSRWLALFQLINHRKDLSETFEHYD